MVYKKKKRASGSGSTGEGGEVWGWKGGLGPAVKSLAYGGRAVRELGQFSNCPRQSGAGAVYLLVDNKIFCSHKNF